jgi:hypothetical protein
MVKRQGAVTVYVVLSLMVLLVAALGLAGFASNSLVRVKQDRNSAIAEQASFAALDHGTGKAFQDITSTVGKFTNQTYDVSTDVDAIAPGATAKIYITPASNGFAWITGTATYNGTTRSARSFLASREVSIWNNAIFAGGSGVGKTINGNADVRGSVHILGDGEPYTDLNGNGTWDAAEAFTDKSPKNNKWDPGETFIDANGDGAYTNSEPYNDLNGNGGYDLPATQTTIEADMSGGAHIGNNYSGMPSNLQSVIPSITTVDGIGTLNADVRVKHGMISIGGSASIGDNGNLDSGLSKGNMDGSYVNDGYTGNQGASSVYSDNGTSNQYDLNDFDLEFPVSTGTGAQTYNAKDGSTWPTHTDYINAKALVIPVNVLLAETDSFTYGPDANGNSVTFTKGSGSGTLNITGIVKVVGDLQIGAKNSDIRYTGSGTIYSTGNINIDGNLLPASGQTFPTTTRLGLIAKGNMNLATGSGSSQLSLAGAFYAQGTIKSAKQNQIAGSLVSNNFDMGTNVPSIYQVPSLTSNMPPAMPGDMRYFTIKARTFRDRSPLPGQSDTFAGGNPYQG